MAKLTSLVQFNGSLAGLTVYNLPGVKDPVVRATWGPSAEDINTKPQYSNTRRNLSENSGRGKAVHWLMKAFNPLKPLVDASTAGHLNALLRVVQKNDTVSRWGERGVPVSRFPHLLEGFALTKELPFDTVVRGELPTTLDRAALSASVALPDLLPRLTFFPPPGYPYCRLVATLGVAPDLLFDEPAYRTAGDFSHCFAQAVYGDWFPSAKGCPSVTLSLQLPYTPPTEAFALVLAVAVQLGEPVIAGGVEPVRLRIGSAKILAVV